MSHEWGYNSCLLHNGSIHTDVGHNSSHNSSMPQGFHKPQFSGGRNGTWSGCPAHSCSSHPASRQVYHLWHLNQIFQFFNVSSPIHSGANRPTYTQWNVTFTFIFSIFSLAQIKKKFLKKTAIEIILFPPNCPPTNTYLLIVASLQPDVVDHWYVKL